MSTENLAHDINRLIHRHGLSAILAQLSAHCASRKGEHEPARGTANAWSYAEGNLDVALQKMVDHPDRRLTFDRKEET